LAKTMINPVNLLVLDEPTNHLDLPSCDVLEDALDAYPGTVVLVTHDRYLIRSVAGSLIAVRDGTARLHPGVDEVVLSPHAAPPAVSAVAPVAVPSVSHARAAEKRTAAERRQARSAATRELRKKAERLERDLGRVESTVAELQRQLAEPDLYQDHERVRQLVTAHDEAKDRAALLTEQWLEVHSALERAEARFA
jgi:ATP-binding cassette subfamily F protein 3